MSLFTHEYFNKIYGITAKSAVYGISEQVLKESPTFYQIKNPSADYFTTCSRSKIQWHFAGYSVYHEMIDNYKKKAFIVKLDDDIYASWCICNKLKFKDKQFIFIEQGQITMISLICKHHIHWNNISKPFDPAEHAHSVHCSNQMASFWGVSTFDIMKRLKGSHNFSKWKCPHRFCKKCRLEAASSIIHYLFYSSHDMVDLSSIRSIIFIQQTCKLISFVLERANTAKHILSGKIDSSSNILFFTSVAIDAMLAFLVYTELDQTISLKQKFQMVMFRELFESFSKFLKLLLQHSYKLKKLKNLDTSNCKGKSIVELCGKIHLLNEYLMVHAFGYVTKNSLIQNYFTNIFDVKNNLILPLVVLSLIFDEQFEIRRRFWINEICMKPNNDEWALSHQWLLSQLHSDQSEFESFRAKCKRQKQWIRCLKKYPLYNKYLSVSDNNLKFDNVECQWRKCEKRKVDMKQKCSVKMWKKCKGCKVVRYCSKHCQKLDWNKGSHKEVCKKLLTMPPPFTCAVNMPGCLHNSH
eukprot:94530_1